MYQLQDIGENWQKCMHSSIVLNISGRCIGYFNIYMCTRIHQLKEIGNF